MLTEFKTEILLKIGAILGKVHIGISTVDATDKIRVLNAPIFKIDEENTGYPGDDSVEEATDNSGDEVLSTSMVEAWS